MAVRDVIRQRVVMGVCAALITAWGGVGLVNGLDSGFSGGLYDPSYRVPGVWPGGLADRSGFRAGDRVISVEGQPVEQLGMESRWPRSLVPGIGESRRFLVEREGERIPLDVVFPPPSMAAVSNRVRAGLVGLFFLGCGLWAFLTVETRHARMLTHIGLAAGVGASAGLGPHLGSWNGVQGHVSTAASALLLILLLRFFATFPASKAVSRSRLAAGVVYGTWGCLVAFLVVELAVHPALYYTTGEIAGPLATGYVLLIAAAVTHTVWKGSRAALLESGMHWVLGGLLLAVAGPVVTPAIAGGAWAWVQAVPILALPLSMALAVRRYSRLSSPNTRTPMMPSTLGTAAPGRRGR